MSAAPARSCVAVVGIAAVVIASMTAAQPLLEERIASHSRDEEHGCILQPEFEVDEVIGAHHVEHRFHPFLHFSLSLLWVGHVRGEILGEGCGWEVRLKRILSSAWTFNQA